MVRIVEVGPRDGLQNEPTAVPTAEKAAFVQRLLESGLKEIEATSFVSPKWVPQLGDAAELWPLLPKGGLYSALVPNERGLDRALETGVQRIALFTAASDAFTQKNINMTVAESLDVFSAVMERFRSERPEGWVRGYVSTAFECPYAGKVDPSATADVARRLLEMGADEVSLGDTIGVAVPREVRALERALGLPKEKVAWHFHDTRGTAVANIAEALSLGYTVFDSSAGGLGGCPYAPGAGGNLATEDLLYFLDRSGVPTGVDHRLVAEASLPILSLLGRSPSSKAQLALLSRP
ncbi:MAG: hydroxymethylglutaryl-CoA lyase [Armatimonadetes bacterium]|nr:hydroxymethylglutaryl-CoA lyase [Armatimonadota bacterium]